MPHRLAASSAPAAPSVWPVAGLVEVQAVSDSVPAPHFGHYNILYTDGRVESSAQPPPELR